MDLLQQPLILLLRGRDHASAQLEAGMLSGARDVILRVHDQKLGK